MDLFYAVMTIVGIITTACLVLVVIGWLVGHWFIRRDRRVKGKGLREEP